MAPARRRSALLGAGFLGAFAAGFVGSWQVKRDAAAAPVEALSEQRLRNIELKLETIVNDMGFVKKDLGIVRCRLNIEGTCPPEHAR